MKYGFVIPVYNHGSALESVVKNLLQYNLPIIIVDDGNNEENKSYISKVANGYPLVTLVTRPKNGGKGRAMADGVQQAKEMGLTHILQIDADGQHDSSRVSYFIQKSQENPDAIICGYPEYDESAPKKRVYGRAFANAWIHIVTLSKEIKDALIGFRVYPVEPYCQVMDRFIPIDGRMGYDIDILVHMSWKGIRVISESVKVIYPIDGISNFRIVRDNLRIGKTYTKLVLGMIVRLPVLLTRKIIRAFKK